MGANAPNDLEIAQLHQVGSSSDLNELFMMQEAPNERVGASACYYLTRRRRAFGSRAIDNKEQISSALAFATEIARMRPANEIHSVISKRIKQTQCRCECLRESIWFGAGFRCKFDGASYHYQAAARRFA